MFVFLNKKTIVIFFIFLSLCTMGFAQENNISDIRYHGSRVPLIASTISIGVAFQISGIALLALGNKYYFDNVAPLQEESKNESAVTRIQNDGETGRAYKQQNSVYVSYLAAGSTMFILGSASTITGVVFALLNTFPPKPKKDKKKNKNAYISDRGSLAISAAKGTVLHLYTNAFYLEFNY